MQGERALPALACGLLAKPSLRGGEERWGGPPAAPPQSAGSTHLLFCWKHIFGQRSKTGSGKGGNTEKGAEPPVDLASAAFLGMLWLAISSFVQVLKRACFLFDSVL